MGNVRALAQEDLRDVAVLRRRMFRHSRWTSEESLVAYLRRIFFENPWRDEEISPLVYEEGGTVLGFVGIVPRPWVLRGKALRGAIATQFMVAPESRGFAAWELLRQAFAGKQDFLLADVGNGSVHPLWERLGGCEVRSYSLFWRCTLRPARSAAARLGNGSALWIAGPMLTAIDAWAAGRTGIGYGKVEPKGSRGPLDPVTMAELLPRLVGPRVLHPRYDAQSTGWLLDEVTGKWEADRVVGMLVRDASGEPVGWFLYVLKKGGSARVVQLIGREGRCRAVLEHLLHDAWAQGATEVNGRFEPAWLADLSGVGCTFHYHGPGMLVHSRAAQATDMVLRGKAVVTGLEGEWWMNF